MRRLAAKKVYLLAKNIADDLVLLARRTQNQYLPAVEVAGQVVDITSKYRIRLEKLKTRHKLNGEVHQALKTVDAFIRKTADTAGAFLAQDAPPDEMALVLESSANSFVNQITPVLRSG
ncbi:MAG: hypothetical protein ACPLQP_07755 [Moorellaceae bacterium]